MIIEETHYLSSDDKDTIGIKISVETKNDSDSIYIYLENSNKNLKDAFKIVELLELVYNAGKEKEDFNIRFKTC